MYFKNTIQILLICRLSTDQNHGEAVGHYYFSLQEIQQIMGRNFHLRSKAILEWTRNWLWLQSVFGRLKSNWCFSLGLPPSICKTSTSPTRPSPSLPRETILDWFAQSRHIVRYRILFVFVFLKYFFIIN